MPLTIYEAMKSTRNPFAKAMFKTISTADELFPLLPFVSKGGSAFEYTRENTLPAFEFVSPGHTTLVESTGTTDRVTVPHREAASDFQVRNFAQEISRDTPGMTEEDNQTRMKLKAAGRKIASLTINGAYATGFTLSSGTIFTPGGSATTPYVDSVTVGPWNDSDRFGPGSLRYTNTGTFLEYRAPGDREYGTSVACATDGSYTLYSSNPSKWIRVTLDVSDATANTEALIRFTSTSNEFDGLKKIMHPAQVVASSGTDGDAISLTLLDRLYDMVRVRENMAYLMPLSLRRKVKTLLVAAQGGDGVKDLMGFKVPSYNDIPILGCDWINADEAKGSATTLSSAYLVSLSAEQGVFMGAMGSSSFNVEADPRDASVLGFQMFDLGQIQGGPNARGKRLVWYGALAMGSYLCAARASELITA